MNVFLAEGNVEIYLSKLHQTGNAEDRDTLLRLLIEELSRMSESREHLANGERRVADGRQRLRKQRELIAGLPPQHRAINRARLLLETLEKTQSLLESHVETLRHRSSAGNRWT